MSLATASPPLSCVAPSVRDLSREQRSALLVDLVKAWFEDAGMPFPIVVRDGEKLLGVFKPEFHPPAKTTIPEVPPEYIDAIRQRIRDVESGKVKTVSTEEFLDLVESELDQTHHTP